MSMRRLRELGLKLTPQRLAILEVLEGNTEHPSAEDIYKQLKPRYPSLSLTTVYNTLEVLAGAGELQEIRIRANKRHFDPNPAPHGHFLCRICGAIDDVETGPLEIQAPFQTKGYFVEKYAPYFYGICPRCRERDRSNNQ
jgi:Fur family peroxide stress response transcriptional regulator